MLKYIIHTGDIHIRNLKRLDEYKEKLTWFVDECKAFCGKHEKGDVAVVVAGDLVHNKTELSPECYSVAAWFLRKLDEVCPTLVIAGNHDITQNNERLDPISTIFGMCDFKQTKYIDKELGYQSGCYMYDDGTVFCLYSSFDGFARPNIDEFKVEHPDCRYIGLFHGEVNSARTDAGYQSTNGINSSYFDGIDCCIMGHIHKRQCIMNDGVPLVYCGSLIQQDFGENISGHGYVIWDLSNIENYQCIDYQEHNYTFYTFKITNENDIDNDNEEIINL